MTQPTTVTESSAGSYVPDLLQRWPADAPRHRQVEGSLVSADISGFTALSERLAAYGREGAEELTALLNQCFGGMIEIIDEFGGDVLKFGGDALLVLFTGDEHTARAAAACFRMRRLIERTWSTPLIKRVKLGISQGIHSGTFDLHLVDAGHQELLVVGPGMTATVTCEGAAERGQVLLSHGAAALVDKSLLGEATEDGSVLAAEPPVSHRRPDATADAAKEVEPFVPEWLVEQTAAGQVAEHRVVTVGFVFFGGADDVLAQHGPDELHARLQALATVTETATARHGVFWLASDVYARGGKIILAAGAPKSTGHDEDAAVRTAREIIESDVGLPIRAGLNRGPVFMGDLGSERRRTFTVMGDAVNLAARLMQKSAPGQLVASRAVLDVVPTRFELEALEPFLVKGKSEPIHAALVGPVVSGDPLAEPAGEADDRIPFVGRRDELALLRAVLDDVDAGTGRVVDLVGEPGIGKSRLVDELLLGRPDLTVLRASGGLYSRATPYFAVSTMLRSFTGIDRTASPAVAGRLMSEYVARHAPDLLDWLPLIAIAFNAEVPMTRAVEKIAAANRASKLREVVVDLLIATLTTPTIIVVDDAPRLDEASDELFGAIARRIVRRPWALASIRRPDGTCFATDGHDDVLRIELPPLLVAETEAVARHALDLGLLDDEDDVDDLVARGVTNPLFLLELIRSGVREGAATPDSIEALVTARIDTLSAADRLLLREASILGSLVDVNLLSDAIGDPGLRSPTRWQPLVGFLAVEGRGRFRFEQGLYREVAYGGLSYRRRRQLHAGVGRVLEIRAGEEWAESSELLSLHFHFAGDHQRSWRYSVIAGDRARAKYAHAEAADFYRRALEAPRSDRPGAESVAAVAESLADMLEIIGNYSEADEVLTLSRRHCTDVRTGIRLLRKEGVICERQGKYSQALRWYGRGLKAVSAHVDDRRVRREEGDLAAAYAGVRFRQGKLWESIRWAHRAEAIAQDLEDTRLLAHSSYLLMTVYGVLRRPEVEDYRNIALPLFEQLGDLTYQGNALNNLGVDAKDAGKWAEALDLYQRSLEVRKQSGDEVGAAFTTHNIGEILSDQGRFDEAEELFNTAQRAWRRAGYQMGIALGASYLGRTAARRGDFERARTLLADGVRRFEELGASHFVLEAKVFMLECEVLAGNGRAAIAAAGPIFELARAVGDPLIEAMLLRSQAWAHFVDGDHAEAETLIARCIEIVGEIGSDYEMALALVMRGKIKDATGRDRHEDHDRARQLLEELGVVQLPRIAGR
jgi:class 3 adenylate cyclase/tetratricopeptide (TPR) repeat protein